MTEVSKLIGEEWKAMSDEQKQKWYNKGIEAKADYELKISKALGGAPPKAALQNSKPAASSQLKKTM